MRVAAAAVRDAEDVGGSDVVVGGDGRMNKRDP